MFVNKLKEFHKKTMEIYRQEEMSQLPEWKKKVLKIHEDSHFLFYFEEYMENVDQKYVLIIRGDHVKGKPEEKTPVYLYDGEGNFMGSGIILTDPDEKEEHHKDIFSQRRNEFLLRLVTYEEKDITSFSQSEYYRILNHLLLSLSLISDLRKQ